MYTLFIATTPFIQKYNASCPEKLKFSNIRKITSYLDSSIKKQNFDVQYNGRITKMSSSMIFYKQDKGAMTQVTEPSFLS